MCETCGAVPCICADRCEDVAERPRLTVGDWLRCKKCNQWHIVEESADATSSSRDMLWFKCPEATGMFYAGRAGMWLFPEEAARWKPGPKL